MIKICLVRHGETVWNRSGTWQGWTDISLNDRGLAQADCVAKALGDRKFKVILTSDLERARVTAEKIAFHHEGAKFIVDERLREIHFGEWEGLTFDEIHERWPGMIDEMYQSAGSIEIPGGESFHDLQTRAFAGLKDAIQYCDDRDEILVVCHGGTNRAIICKLLGLNLNHAWNFRQGNTSITEIEYYGEKGFNMLALLNDTYHLRELEGTDLCG